IRVVSPKARPADFCKWGNTIRLMRERDGLTKDEIRSTFEWANHHSFWSTNILSPDSLRKNFAKIDAQRHQIRANENAGDPPPTTEKPISMADRKESLRRTRESCNAKATKESSDE
ncbi:MAG: hypothetical protein WBD31_11885, partial [Rubripirellula sp.]